MLLTRHALRRLAPAAVLAAALVAGLLTAVPAASAAVAPVPASKTFTARERGYDVSYPQCLSPLPGSADFAVVGVDGGRPFDPNPCLAEQIAWARSSGRPQYYLNTANPGPRLSDHWPVGQRGPRLCTRAAQDSQACAFDYGFNFARDSFRRAQVAARAVGAADVRRSAWWLDVEMHNTWESIEYGARTKFLRNDAAVLAGARAALERRGVKVVGVYSTAHQWEVITGGATLGRAPVWYAGLGSRATAARHCRPEWSFTGGRIRLAQFQAANGLDGDLRC